MTDDEDDDGYHCYGGEMTTMSRPNAVVRFLATSAAVIALPANAAIVPASEFSESPTSGYSIARAMYDGKDIFPTLRFQLHPRSSPPPSR